MMYTSCNYFKICAHIVSNTYKYCTVTDAGCVLRVQTQSVEKLMLEHMVEGTCIISTKESK